MSLTTIELAEGRGMGGPVPFATPPETFARLRDSDDASVVAEGRRLLVRLIRLPHRSG